MENVKREIKTHQANLQEFETKHNITQPIPNGNDPNEVIYFFVKELQHEIFQIMRMQMARQNMPPGVAGGPMTNQNCFPVQQHPQMHPQFQVRLTFKRVYSILQ